MRRRIPLSLAKIAFLWFVLCHAQSAPAQEVQPATSKPRRNWVVYLLPHSHVDIGYTHVQTEVERIQWGVIDKALDLCEKTVAYPQGAQFKWNAEVLWAVDSYLRQATPEKQQRLIEAIRNGQVGLDAFYGNQLTALCRPEELLRLMQWSDTIGRRCGVNVDSAMISDVPGFTWGLVSAMAQAGAKYLSIGPNLDQRVGRALSEWEDKPFYWVGPDGQQKVLCWTVYKGYTLCGIGFKLADQLPDYLAHLERRGYPYDIVQLHWCRGDNQPPDASLPDVVKEWNAKHDYPKLMIATTTEAFHAFEERYAAEVPHFSGDFTPYWEDGAASSARETAVNRASAERLVQAETLSAMLAPRKYSADEFSSAWRNVLLYDEHTWGASQHNVIDYNVPFIVNQWRVKQGFALDGDKQSRELSDRVLADRDGKPIENAVDVFNTSSWPRTDLVVLSREQSSAGDVVVVESGSELPSQRLSTGELAFLVKDVPPLAGRRYAIQPGKSTTPQTGAKAEATTLAAPGISVELDPQSGTITSLRCKNVAGQLADTGSGIGLNRYYYVVQDQLKNAQQAGPAKIAVKEAGPLVASLMIESDAPGCAKLSREIRVIDGLDRVDITNVVDKKEVREKEGVHFGFAFNVPDGVMRVDIPWAVFRPELDQLPGACKEWLTAGRWVDVSNKQYGVTWATVDAPMIEVGALTAGMVGRNSDPDNWMAKLEPSQTVYSWVMNNYWYTNYRAFQSGPTTFRYSLLPHPQYDQAVAQRFGIERSQPLLVTPAQGVAPTGRPFVELDTPEVIVASIKPSNDGKAIILRLFGAGGEAAKARLKWGGETPMSLWISDLAENRITKVTGAIDVPTCGIVTLRAE